MLALKKLKRGVIIKKSISFKFYFFCFFFLCFLYACESNQIFLRPEEPPKYIAETKVDMPSLKDASCEKPAPPIVKKEVPKVVPRPKTVVLNDIYFAFDRYDIRPKDAEILRKNLEWFKANPGKKVLIEGHCDERGTIEYNLALGQKRAEAARTYLIKLGVNPELLETISYGKERPFDPGHNPKAWAKNRRAHFSVIEEK